VPLYASSVSVLPSALFPSLLNTKQIPQEEGGHPVPPQSIVTQMQEIEQKNLEERVKVMA